MSGTAQLILRLGLAFVFAYPAHHAIGTPDSWIGYFPPFVLALGVPHELLLHAFGAVELLVAAWLVWGRHLLWPAGLAALMLVAIVAFNGAQFEILFRDLGLAAAAAALAYDAWATRNRAAPEAS